MNDKRQEERVTINKEFESFGQFVEQYIANVSRSGVFVSTESPLPVGSTVNLRFSVVMDEVEVIEGLGEVVRVQQSPPGMGVRFRQLGAYSETLIEKLLTGMP